MANNPGTTGQTKENQFQNLFAEAMTTFIEEGADKMIARTNEYTFPTWDFFERTIFGSAEDPEYTFAHNEVDKILTSLGYDPQLVKERLPMQYRNFCSVLFDSYRRYIKTQVMNTTAITIKARLPEPYATFSMLKTQDKKKQTNWFNWSLKTKLVKAQENESHSVFIVGPPGKGKTNVMYLFIEEALGTKNVVIYTPFDVRPKSQFVHQVSKLTDLFIDTPDIPSILRVFLINREIEEKYGYNPGLTSLLVYDEGNLGDDASAITTQGKNADAVFQLRRHLRINSISGGVKMLAPSKMITFITVLIEAHADPINETDGEGNQASRRSIEITYPDPSKPHEWIYDMPKSKLRTIVEHSLDLSASWEVDMSVKRMLDDIEYNNQPIDEDIIRKAANYCRAIRGISMKPKEDMRGKNPNSWNLPNVRKHLAEIEKRNAEDDDTDDVS